MQSLIFNIKSLMQNFKDTAVGQWFSAIGMDDTDGRSDVEGRDIGLMLKDKERRKAARNRRHRLVFENRAERCVGTVDE